jgi:hypothetical protein
VTNLIEFTSYVLNCMENGVQVDAVYPDFFKAFDKVSHGLLLRKLAKLGFGGSFLAWILAVVRPSGSQSRRLNQSRDQVFPRVVIWGICSLFYS